MEFRDLIFKIFAYNLLRYILIAGLAFLVFYVLFKKKWSCKKIQSRFPKTTDYWREFTYSMITIIIFILVALSIFATPLREFTLRYDTISEYGWGYFFFSIITMILIHDTYFYWMHRAMHIPKIFKYVHKVHHLSTNPSPWAAYAFHPIEAIFEACIIFCIVFVIPYHASAIFAFLAFMIVYNVYGHLGFELYPKGFNSTWIGRWVNTSVNHNQHHESFHGNYGLYFLFWDRWLGTIREDYDLAFEESDRKRGTKLELRNGISSTTIDKSNRHSSSFT